MHSRLHARAQPIVLQMAFCFYAWTILRVEELLKWVLSVCVFKYNVIIAQTDCLKQPSPIDIKIYIINIQNGLNETWRLSDGGSFKPHNSPLRCNLKAVCGSLYSKGALYLWMSPQDSRLDACLLLCGREKEKAGERRRSRCVIIARRVCRSKSPLKQTITWCTVIPPRGNSNGTRGSSSWAPNHFCTQPPGCYYPAPTTPPLCRFFGFVSWLCVSKTE